MKKIILVSILALVLSLAFVPVSNAQIAKEGTALCTVIQSWTMLGSPIDLDGPDSEERDAAILEILGVVLSDTGKGLFHNLSFRNIGVFYFNKGETEKTLVYGVWTDLDGDMVFYDITMSLKGKVIGKLLGGTGKFAGIEGTTELVESTETVLRPSKDGTTSMTTQIKIHYKLP